MRVASVGAELKCFDWSDQSLIYTYKPETGADINTISWAKDCAWIILVPNSGSPELVSINQAKLLSTLNTVQFPKSAAFQNTTKRSIAISSLNGNLLTYDIKNKLIVKKFPSPPAPFFKVEYTIKDTHLLGGCENGEVYIFNNNTNIRTGCLKVPKSQTLTNFRCSGIKNNLVGGCSEEGVVTLWDINVSKSTFWMEAHKAPVNDLCFPISSEKLLISIGCDRRICIFDITDKKLAIDIMLDYSPTAIDFCPDGKSIAVGLFNGKILSYDVRNMKNCINQLEAHNTNVKQISFEKLTKTQQSSIIDLPEENSKKETLQIVEDSISSIICKKENESENRTDIDSNIDMFLATNNSIELEKDTTNHSHPEFIPYSLELVNPVQHKTPAPNEYKNVSTKLNNKNDKRQSLKPQMHSTPKDLPFSPIISPATNNIAPSEDLKKFIKDTIKEEVEVIKRELKNELEAVKDHIVQGVKEISEDRMFQMRSHFNRMFCDLQMNMCREFLDLEKKLE